MIIDLHSHYLPVDAVTAAEVPIELTESADGSYRFASAQQTLTLNQELVDLEVQRAVLQRQELDRRILAVPPFCLQYELPIDAGIRWSRASNNGIAEGVRRFPDAFVGFATVPLQDVAAALRELDRAATQLGLAGVEIATNINGVELDAPTLDPFWERVSHYGLPVLVHPHYVAGAGRMGDYHLRNLVGNPTETALAGARLLFGGVLERHTELKIILSHGGGALPHIIGRLRHGSRVRSECQVRAFAPIEHLRRLYFDTVVFDDQVLRHLVETVGASQVVLGTDYPFDMSEAAPVTFVRRSGLSRPEVETILGNGERLIGEVALRAQAEPG